MKITIISGSHRHESESARVAKYVQAELQKLPGQIKTHLVDLADNPLPLWEEGVWENSDKWQKVWKPIATELQSSDAFVVISPEWHGMVPSGLKNFFLLTTHADVGHKPALIVAVSSSVGGSYPVVELRTSSYKNSRICYLPEHVILRDVKKLFHGDKAASDADDYHRKRLTYALKLLGEYGKAFKGIRESGVIDHKTYANGM